SSSSSQSPLDRPVFCVWGYPATENPSQRTTSSLKIRRSPRSRGVCHMGGRSQTQSGGGDVPSVDRIGQNEAMFPKGRLTSLGFNRKARRKGESDDREREEALGDRSGRGPRRGIAPRALWVRRRRTLQPEHAERTVSDSRQRMGVPSSFWPAGRIAS